MNTNARTLNTADLAVGQKLILVRRRGGNWGSAITRTESTLTIKKVLKTRLVCEDEEGREYRFIVEFSASYGYRNGQVSTDLEGSRSRDAVWSYRDTHKALFTLDDQDLIEGRLNDEVRNATVKAEAEARAALDAFKKSLSVETAEETIAALQKFIDAKKAQ